jgi:phenylalanyl-tRNA synthetase beta chain
MKFSSRWLARYVELPESIDELAARLTAAGLAVEGIERGGNDGDVLLDVDVTTNRPDCMNHVGLAREIAVLFDRPLLWAPPALTETAERTTDAIAVELSTPDCPDYVARVVRGIEVGPSPDWLRDQLEAIGQRSINNVVDVTNFVLWETGQPIHAFDLDRISGARIEVRYARPGEVLTTLDGERRELTPEVLVIADAERPVALAGIMGGLDSEVTEATRDVLIESAHFDRTAVRLGARRLGMHTDASHRFERGADPAACRPAADRVAELLVEVAGGEILSDAIESPHPEFFGGFEGTVDLGRLNAFAGVEYPADRVEHFYHRLGFEPRPGDAGKLRLQVPSWRYYDFWQRRADGRVWEADLFEEAMRMFGFDEIPADLPAIGPPDAGTSLEHRKRERIRGLLAACGYSEAINFAFQHRDGDRLFPGLGAVGEPLEIANPLSEQYEVLRRSLLPNLLESARFNQRRGAAAVRLFEIGRLFPGGDAEEIEALALIAGGGSEAAWDRQAVVDLFDAKGVLECLFEAFDGAIEVRPAELSGIVAGTGSEILAAGDVVGYLGRIDDGGLSYPLIAAELSTAALRESDHPQPVQAPSRFPSVTADLTLTHSLEVPWAAIERAIAGAGVEQLSVFGLRDRYLGKGVPEGAVNTTIYFIYNADDRSLTQEEVNERQAALTRELEQRFGWQG